MGSGAKTDRITEFGDFQTPSALSLRVCKLLSDLKFQPASVIEPTCGLGSFLFAALEQFPTITKAIGLDISPDYIDATTYFGASVNACVLVCHFSPSIYNLASRIYYSIGDRHPKRTIGIPDGELVASLELYRDPK